MLTMGGAMTREHPRWEEFCDRLYGGEGFRDDNAGKPIRSILLDLGEYGALAHTITPEKVDGFVRAILAKMGLSEDEITQSRAYFRGGSHQ